MSVCPMGLLFIFCDKIFIEICDTNFVSKYLFKNKYFLEPRARKLKRITPISVKENYRLDYSITYKVYHRIGKPI